VGLTKRLYFNHVTVRNSLGYYLTRFIIESWYTHVFLLLTKNTSVLELCSRGSRQHGEEAPSASLGTLSAPYFLSFASRYCSLSSNYSSLSDSPFIMCVSHQRWISPWEKHGSHPLLVWYTKIDEQRRGLGEACVLAVPTEYASSSFGSSDHQRHNYLYQFCTEAVQGAFTASHT